MRRKFCYIKFQFQSSVVLITRVSSSGRQPAGDCPELQEVVVALRSTEKAPIVTAYATAAVQSELHKGSLAFD